MLVFAPLAVAYHRASLAGVRLQMTPTQVRHALGRPSSIYTSSRGRCSNTFTYQYPDRLVVTFGSEPNLTDTQCSAVVFSIVTRSPRDRVNAGLHVGSRYRTLTDTFRHLLCSTASFPRLVAGNGMCYLYYRTIQQGVNGPIYYSLGFRLRHNRITAISLYSGSPD